VGVPDGGRAAAYRRSFDVAAGLMRNKRPEHFVDKSSLADVHASLEHAADVLSTVKGGRGV